MVAMTGRVMHSGNRAKHSAALKANRLRKSSKTTDQVMFDRFMKRSNKKR